MNIKATVIRIFSLLICWVAACCVAQPLRPTNLQFDMFAGYNGLTPEAAWFPVVFEVKNDGPTFTGVIELEPEAYGGGAVRSVVVELPTGSLKRLVIPAFASGRFGGNWNARLLDERGRLRAEATSQLSQPRPNTNWKTRLMIGLARSPRGVPSFAPILSKQQDLQPTCAFLQPAIFPDNPIALERLNAIYLNSEKAAELKDNQVKALVAWLHAGGHLIVGVEQITDINSSPWLRGIFPVELTGMKTLERHPELQDWLREPMPNPSDKLFGEGTGYQPPPPGRRQPKPPANQAPTSAPGSTLAPDTTFELAALPIATGNLRGGEVVVGAPDMPYVVTAPCDRGRVTALLFSPEREPVRTWGNLSQFWARLVEVPPILYTVADVHNRYEPNSDGVFGAMVDSRQIRKMPVGWLLLLLVVYLVVIGPFDRWWLKKINRPMLTWVTFPCYVVLFSLLIYFIGYKLRAGETEWNELHVVDVFANGERAELRGRTYASIYSPANQRYKLANQSRVATLRGELIGTGVAQDRNPPRILQQGDAFSADVFVPVWISQLFVSDWWQSVALPASLSVSRQGNGYQVTVDNRLDRPLKPACLIVGDQVFDLGGLSGGQKSTVTLSAGQGKPLSEWVWDRGVNFQSAVQQRTATFGGAGSGRIDDLPNASMAACFLSELTERQANTTFLSVPGLDLSPLVNRGHAVLLAWSGGYTPIKPINQFKPLRSHRDTLWRISCPVTP